MSHVSHHTLSVVSEVSEHNEFTRMSSSNIIDGFPRSRASIFINPVNNSHNLEIAEELQDQNFSPDEDTHNGSPGTKPRSLGKIAPIVNPNHNCSSCSCELW